ncbi:MAG: hypothetical protein LRY43_00895, partial [Gammaproteobacteria bacterium]|nr:hypothetical protein [Gammaproteobacteria bacterium]
MNKLTKALQKKFYEADLIAKNSGLGDEETQVYRHVMMITALANEMSPNNRKALEKMRRESEERLKNTRCQSIISDLLMQTNNITSSFEEW